MSFQFSTAGRNAGLDAIFTTIGASAILKIRTGAAPANVATLKKAGVRVHVDDNRPQLSPADVAKLEAAMREKAKAD